MTPPDQAITAEEVGRLRFVQPWTLVGMILENADFGRDELAIWIKAPGGVTVQQARTACHAPSLLSAIERAANALEGLATAWGGLDGELGAAHTALQNALKLITPPSPEGSA